MAFYSYWHDGDSRDGALGDVGPLAAAVINALAAGKVLNNATMGPYLANDTLGGFSCSGAVSPVTLTSGLANVNGRLMLSDASSTIAVPTPAASTRMDILCLQYDAATNQVRPYLHQGIEGAGVYPSLTQTAITWEVPLWGVTITTLGAITLADLRVYVQPAVRISDSQLAAGSIDRLKLVRLDPYPWLMPWNVWNITDAAAIAMTYQDYGWPLPDAKLSVAIATIDIPAAWTREYDLSVTPVIYTAAGVTGNCYARVYAKWGALNEAYNTHTETNSWQSIAVPTAERQAAGAAVVIPHASASSADILTVSFERDATAGTGMDTLGDIAYFRGFYLTYKAK